MAKNQTKPKKTCAKCERTLVTENNFYQCTNSPLFPNNYFHICRKCVGELSEQDDGYEITLMMLHAMNKPFIQGLFDNSESVGKYISQINSFPQYKGLSWDNSDIAITSSKSNKNNQNKEYEIINKDEGKTFDNQDKEDILKMLGYDPFQYANEEDKPQMYSMLVNFIDDSTLEDGFKLQAVVEIVTGFNQIDKINRSMTGITSNPEAMATNSGGIKTLATTKKTISDTLVKLAEENGISVKHNNQKSKGAGTLTGIIKSLQEKGVEQADVNLYDIETSQGMAQVADISNQSIVKQLMFDENDYTQMLIEQRDLIQELDSKASRLEEENRLLKKQGLSVKDD
ncbi:hypothetical protein [Aquibacillus saliphilus]|uniref:hypothetical protein n=1 Tax=Aquibacillus saliphilus TaxID=1909422 RepID=UPI001CF077A2|nr:hypothetical protein [Aquibacillus saliphilus]